MDPNPDSPGFHLADAYAIGPKAADDDFVTTIARICSEQKIDLLFSLVTGELILLSAMQEELKRLGTHVSISSVDALRKSIQKDILYHELQQAGMAVPAFQVVRTGEQLKEAIAALGYPDRPVCFKPTVSDGSRGFHILDATVDRFQLLFREKPNSAYVSQSELYRIIEGRDTLPELLVMEYLPYEEYSVDLLADHGRVIVAVPRLRQATTGGITTKSVIRQEQDVIDYAAAAVRQLGLHGNIGVQVRRDIDRQPKIVEINPRIQGTIVHCTAAGVNLPVLAAKLALGLPIAEEELSVQWGTRMVRYWEEVFYDAHGSSYAL